jgi:hypothetical protein
VPLLTISYGTAERQPRGPTVTIDTAGRDPLRLNDGPYAYDQGTQGPGPTAAERLAFLRDHLTGLCDMWAKRPRQFIGLYFRFIECVMARDRPRIEDKIHRLGGLFTSDDYAFSALRPLPRAHLPVGNDETRRVDFAFWTGTALVAVDITSDDTRGPVWEARRATLSAAAVQPIEIPAAIVARDDPAAIESALPSVFTKFWHGETLPSSPFKATGLSDGATGEPDF